MLRYATLAAIAVFCALLPYLDILPGWTPALATVTAFMALSLIGLNLIFGVTGMLAFGQAAFVALPGYAAGMLQAQGVPGLIAIPMGVLIAVLIARLIAEIFIRLPGIYFAIGTLGFAFVVEGLARAFPSVTGGASGLVLIPPVTLGRAGWYALAVVSVACGALAFALLVRDRFLRTLKLVRNDELAAQVLGIDVARVKVRVFTIGSAFSAVGGVLLAYYVQVLAPESGGVNASLEQLAMVIIGGSGSVLGPLLGAAAVQWLFAVAGGADRYELLVYGLGFFLVVLFAPAGIMGALRKLPLGFLARKAAPRDAGGAAPRPAQETGQCSASKAPPAREGVCLAVDGLTKNFGGLVAVSDVGFEVRFGQVVALIGPNGAGKSTLFNLISGIEPPTAGRVLLEGRELSGAPIHSRAASIGRSFQVPRLVPEMTALENVVARLDHLPLKADEAERRLLARRQLATFGLDELADRPVREIGLGYHKLIELARASAGRPSLLLLDEPAVGLTGEEIERLTRALERLRREGAAILVVEHNVEFVATIADELVVLDSGRVIARGAPKAVIADPKVQDAYFGVLA
jgi:ABC-type branched-subunit amino acid transport system ATPase component/ABC-type branched-subunit amino acid transport system permease subunit